MVSEMKRLLITLSNHIYLQLAWLPASAPGRSKEMIRTHTPAVNILTSILLSSGNLGKTEHNSCYQGHTKAHQYS